MLLAGCAPEAAVSEAGPVAAMTAEETLMQLGLMPDSPAQAKG